MHISEMSTFEIILKQYTSKSLVSLNFGSPTHCVGVSHGGNDRNLTIGHFFEKLVV